MKKENRIRKDFDNEINYWWLRSSDSHYNSDDVACVIFDGYVGSGVCNNDDGIVPAFII